MQQIWSDLFACLYWHCQEISSILGQDSRDVEKEKITLPSQNVIALLKIAESLWTS